MARAWRQGQGRRGNMRVDGGVDGGSRSVWKCPNVRHLALASLVVWRLPWSSVAVALCVWSVLVRSQLI